jgi:hypothetical protein
VRVKKIKIKNKNKKRRKKKKNDEIIINNNLKSTCVNLKKTIVALIYISIINATIVFSTFFTPWKSKRFEVLLLFCNLSTNFIFVIQLSIFPMYVHTLTGTSGLSILRSRRTAHVNSVSRWQYIEKKILELNKYNSLTSCNAVRIFQVLEPFILDVFTQHTKKKIFYRLKPTVSHLKNSSKSTKKLILISLNYLHPHL